MKTESLWLFFSKIIQIISGLALIRLITSVLDINDVGTYYLFLSIYLFFSMSLFNPYGQYMTRNLYEWQSENSLSLEINRYIKIIVFLSFLGCVILLFLSNFNLVNLDLVKIFLCGAYLIFVTINQFLLHSINSLSYSKKFSQLTIISSILNILVPTAFVFQEYIYLDKVELILLGIVLANLFTMVCCYSFLIGREEKKAREAKQIKIKTIFFYCIPISIYTSLLWVINSGYRIGVEDLVGLAGIAILAVSFAVSTQLMSVVESLTTQVFQPKILNKMDLADKREREKYLSEYVNETIAIYFCFSIFFSLCIKYAFLVMVSSKYLVYFYIGVIAIWSEFFRISCNSLSMVYFSENNLKKFIYPYFFAATFLILNFIFILNINFDIDIIDLCAFLIFLSNFLCFTVAWLMRKSVLHIFLNYKFIMKRLLFVSPAFVFLILIFNVSFLDISHLIQITIFSIFFLILFLLSLKNVSFRGFHNES